MGMIRIDTTICAACRICELGCSFHHLGAFAPRRSSILSVSPSSIGIDAPATCSALSRVKSVMNMASAISTRCSCIENNCQE